ncbi:MAG TPA: chitobiase/beta-hexosaminidase C-terminal domain-containing protein [bacterium]
MLLTYFHRCKLLFSILRLANIRNHCLSVTITSETPEATIYYTSDGSDPSTSSFVFTGQPILVANHSVGDSLTFLADNDPDPDDDYKPQTFRSMTIKAIAVKGSEQSPITEAVYVLDLVDATFNIPYADPPSAGGTEHQLDVFQPHGEKKNAVLLFIHGGAWKQGEKKYLHGIGQYICWILSFHHGDRQLPALD